MKYHYRLYLVLASIVSTLFSIGCITTSRESLYRAVRDDTVSLLDKRNIMRLEGIEAPVGNYGLKLIHAAAMYSSDANLIRRLVEVDPQPFAQEELFGATPLHFAAGLNSSDRITRALIQRGNQINARDHNQATPLHWFFQRKNTRLSILTTLLNAGSEINAGDEQENTALHFAIQHAGYLDAIQMLIGRGAPLNAQNEDGFAPLHILAQSEYADPDIIAMLVQSGADINIQDRTLENTPLHIAAAQNRNLAITESLIAQGVTLDLRNKNNFTPLHSAAASAQDAGIITALINAGSSINASGGLYNSTPLHLAAQDNPQLSIVEALIDAGADIDAQDSDGDTPLHAAVQSNPNPVSIVGILLTRGADTTIENEQGVSAAQLIAEDRILQEALPDYGVEE